MQVVKLLTTDILQSLPLLGQELGVGADGQCFELTSDPDKVIKFSVLYEYSYHEIIRLENIDQVYSSIKQVLNYLIEKQPSSYAKVYQHKYLNSGVRQFGGADQQRYICYYYLMEKLLKLSLDENKVFHSLFSHEDANKIKKFSSSKIKKMLEGMSRGLDFDAEKIMLFHDNFTKLPVEHLDVHARNIMRDKDGNFKMIDFDRCILKEKYV